MGIFTHKDNDGDEMEVKEPDPYELGRHRGSLLFVVKSDDLEPRSVALTPAKVDELIGALERWRSGVVTARETSTPPADLNPIYDAIVKRLTDEWLPRVLPLHQAPQAAVPKCSFGLHRGGCVCGPDPEPHDVGHAEAPDPLDDPCDDCGAEWGGEATPIRVHKEGCGWREPAGHRPQDCPGPPECTEGAKTHPVFWSDAIFGKPSYDAEPEHGRLMANLPRRVHSERECGECGHSWRMHPPAFGVSYCAQYTNAVVCGCKATRSAP